MSKKVRITLGVLGAVVLMGAVFTAVGANLPPSGTRCISNTPPYMFYLLEDGRRV